MSGTVCVCVCVCVWWWCEPVFVAYICTRECAAVECGRVWVWEIVWWCLILEYDMYAASVRCFVSPRSWHLWTSTADQRTHWTKKTARIAGANAYAPCGYARWNDEQGMVGVCVVCLIVMESTYEWFLILLCSEIYCVEVWHLKFEKCVAGEAGRHLMSVGSEWESTPMAKMCV